MTKERTEILGSNIGSPNIFFFGEIKIFSKFSDFLKKSVFLKIFPDFFLSGLGWTGELRSKTNLLNWQKLNSSLFSVKIFEIF